MDQTLRTLVLERYENLPERIQSLIVKPQTETAVRIIAEKHHLPEDKTQLLVDLVTLILLTFEKSVSFEERIVEELLIPGSVAASIARDIESTIFSEVRDELETIYKERAQYEKEMAEEERVQNPQTTTQELQERELPVTQRTYQQPIEETPPEPPATPRYVQHLTNTPRYDADPYREKPE